MFKKYFLLFLIATFSCNLYAQVKTNFNNIEKLTSGSKFSANYTDAIFTIDAPDTRIFDALGLYLTYSFKL